MVALGRLLVCHESLQVTSCFAFMESSDDSSHIFDIFDFFDLAQADFGRVGFLTTPIGIY